MRYQDFERTMSVPRMNRYRTACGGNSRKAMTLYRLNLRLSQEMFTVISCFEVALRNVINTHYTGTLGNDWLRDAVRSGGRFDNHNSHITATVIRDAIRKLGTRYTHPKLVAELGFGFWRYLFSRHQYRAGGQTLLAVFPSLPPSTPAMQYNAIFVFNELAKTNDIRNRIAHHEAICFTPGTSVKDTTYVRQHYAHIIQLFQWMDINETELLYGLDHIILVCDKIDNL